METVDPQAFIKQLAYFVRTHEKALANALILRQSNPALSVRPATAPAGALAGSRHAATSHPLSTTASSASGYFSIPYFSFASTAVKPAKLSLTPNQLYYLLCRFEELGVAVGPMNVRLENIHAESTGYNYVSFLDQAPRMHGRSSDRDSVHSVSSVRSVMSSMSSMWASFSLGGSSTAKAEKRRAAALEDLRYLYSAFTKIPCLKLAADHNMRRIAGYEEFPFDTAVPTYIFKNVSELEITDLDFRSFHGWDRLAESLRSLTIRRGNVDDPMELLMSIVLDDMDRRRHRSSKPQYSPVTASSPFSRSVELARSVTAPESPVPDGARAVKRGSPDVHEFPDNSSADARHSNPSKFTSSSPPRPHSSRRMSAFHQSRPSTSMGKPRRRSSTSSNSSPTGTPRTSSSNLASLGGLPPTKWRFLRHLSLPDNGLMTITSNCLAPLCSTLLSLDLSSNLFTQIPESLASLVSLRALNLSHCMIDSLHSLTRSPLPAITVLNLRGNRLASLAGIERLPSLERLDLRDNKLTDPTELARLTSMPEFHDVFVRHNPFTKSRPDHRILIFNLFRRTPGYDDDITIDGSCPSSSEKRMLSDRVPEPMAVPVIPPPLEEEEDAPPEVRPRNVSVPSAAASTPQPVGILSSTPQETGSEGLGHSYQRRRGPRRRIVNITEDDSSPRSPGSQRRSFDSPEVTYSPVPSMSGHRRTSSNLNRSVSMNMPQQYGSPTVRSRPASATPQQMAKDTSRGDADFTVSNLQYQERIDALRGDFPTHNANGSAHSHFAAQPMLRQGIASVDS